MQHFYIVFSTQIECNHSKWVEFTTQPFLQLNLSGILHSIWVGFSTQFEWDYPLIEWDFPLKLSNFTTRVEYSTQFSFEWSIPLGIGTLILSGIFHSNWVIFTQFEWNSPLIFTPSGKSHSFWVEYSTHPTQIEWNFPLRLSGIFHSIWVYEWKWVEYPTHYFFEWNLPLGIGTLILSGEFHSIWVKLRFRDFQCIISWSYIPTEQHCKFYRKKS